MPHPVNAPRFRVVKTQDGLFVAMCCTDALNVFPIGQERGTKDEAVIDCMSLARITSRMVPVGEIVWRDDGK